MNLLDLLNIECINCKGFIDIKNNNYPDLEPGRSYLCRCNNLVLDVFNNNKVSFYMNLQDNYQIQIHTLFQNKPLTFIFYYFSAELSKQLLTLNYFPENLNWKNSNNLLDQLLLLTIFK